jgi:hypothetical protein
VPRSPSRPAGALALGLALVSGPAYGLDPDDETRTVARELARDGAQLADAGKCADAIELFERAYTLVGAPTIAVMRARCLVQLGRLIEGLEVYERILRQEQQPTDPEAFKRAYDDAATEAQEVRARIPRLQIMLLGQDARSKDLKVHLDGRLVPPALLGIPRPIDPGPHRLEATVAAKSRAAREMSLEEGRRYVVDLRLRPLSTTTSHSSKAAASNAQSTLGWVALAVGATGLATGAVTALLASDRKSTLDTRCDAGRCPESVRDDLDTFRTLRTASFVAYGIGFGAAAAGGVLLLTAPKREAPPGERAGVRGWVGLGSAGVAGRF